MAKTFSPRARDDTLETIDGIRFFPLNESLQIISADKKDSGIYQCVASNSEGKSDITAVLDVKGISVTGEKVTAYNYSIYTQMKELHLQTTL